MLRPEERRDRIVDLLREGARVSVDALAAALQASRETVRRDLAELARRGLVRKFHGGAGLPEPAGEGPFQTRMSEHPREKRAIGRRAAALFGPGDTLFVDTGTTSVVFAEELAKGTGLTVVTNCLTIAQLVSGSGRGNRAFLIGGEYRDAAAQTLGALAVEQIARFHAAHAVLTVGAIDPAGIMDFDLGETEVARAMIAQARTVTVIADSSKLGRRGLFEVCPLARVDRLVVDRLADGPLAAALQAAVEVIVALPQAATQ
jgi:DeoR family transcriptional regulator, glycerol-3-phosphate regulon repressor